MDFEDVVTFAWNYRWWLASTLSVIILSTSFCIMQTFLFTVCLYWYARFEMNESCTCVVSGFDAGVATAVVLLHDRHTRWAGLSSNLSMHLKFLIITLSSKNQWVNYFICCVNIWAVPVRLGVAGPHLPLYFLFFTSLHSLFSNLMALNIQRGCLAM